MAKKNLSKTQIQSILDRDLGNVRVFEKKAPTRRESDEKARLDSAAQTQRPQARLDLAKIKNKQQRNGGASAAGASLDSARLAGATRTPRARRAADDDDTAFITVVPKNASADAPGIGAKSVLISKSKKKVIAQQG